MIQLVLLHWFTCVCQYVHICVANSLYTFIWKSKWNMFGAGFLKYDDVIEAHCYVVDIPFVQLHNSLGCTSLHGLCLLMYSSSHGM